MKEDINENDRFDCKVGDQALRRHNDKIQTGTVTATGKTNAHGNPLDAEVQWEDGSKNQVNPFDQDVVILPPKDEVNALPAELLNFMRKRKLLLARKAPCSEWTYRLVRKSDLKEVEARITEVSFSDLRLTMEEGRLVIREGKPCMDFSETVLTLSGKGVDREELEKFADWQNYS
jgi:hypothetical protein